MRDIRASEIAEKMGIVEYGSDETVTVAHVDWHGDTVLITDAEGNQTTFDRDEVVQLVSEETCGHGTWLSTCREPHGEIRGSLSSARRDADNDHTPVKESAFDDDIADNCALCGLAVTPDGKRHGTATDEEDWMVYPSTDASSGVVFVAIEALDNLMAFLTPEQAEQHAQKILDAAKRAREMNEGEGYDSLPRKDHA